MGKVILCLLIFGAYNVFAPPVPAHCIFAAPQCSATGRNEQLSLIGSARLNVFELCKASIYRSIKLRKFLKLTARQIQKQPTNTLEDQIIRNLIASVVVVEQENVPHINSASDAYQRIQKDGVMLDQLSSLEAYEELKKCISEVIQSCRDYVTQFCKLEENRAKSLDIRNNLQYVIGDATKTDEMKASLERLKQFEHQLEYEKDRLRTKLILLAGIDAVENLDRDVRTRPSP